MSFHSSSRKNRQTFSEINITPLTDVFLVLLVIMLLIAPLLDEQGVLKVDLPTANSSKAQKNIEIIQPINIEINEDGEIAINNKIIVQKNDSVDQIYSKVYDEITKLSPLTGNKTEADKKPKVRLKADKKTFYGRVVGVYDALQKAKINNQVGQLVLVVEETAISN